MTKTKHYLELFILSVFSLQMGLASFSWADTKVYDVSGPNGEKDPDGQSYTGSASTGSDGRNGEDAIEVRDSNGRLAKKGYEAGDLNLTLSVVENPNDKLIIKIEGNSRGPEKKTIEVVRDSLPLDNNLTFRFRAKGGRGGKGGNGGRGENGGRGYSGRDATRYSNGTNGGSGGDGGNEGDSTDGGDAGNGGKITLRVPIRDTDLAMLFHERNVEGNSGGERGQGEGVGQGGPGGSGGSSYSWTEDHETTSRDSQGNEVKSTYTTYHSNSGGYDGSSGSNGRHSSKNTHDGRNSEPGKLTYEVVQEDGNIIQYKDIYDLTLLPNYELFGALNNNGFFEPGETVTIKNITVVNSGKAPTPKYQLIKLFIESNSHWIISDKIELTLPHVLNPGDTYTFDNQVITFHLNEKPRKQAGLMREQDVVDPDARVTRVERKFRTFTQNASSSKTISVQYPIQITPLDSLLTLAPGEVGRAYFRIQNISQQTIGKMPNLDAREAHTIFKRVGGDVQTDSFILVDSMNNDADFDPANGITKAIEGLKPGEERLLEILIGFQPGATDYSEAVIQPELYLQSILDPENVPLAQFEPFTLRVANTFDYNQNSDILLIANSSLDNEALDALRATAIVKHLKMDIWDFSYYGFFNFSNRVQDYETLFDAYRGKTIMILGNNIKTPGGDTRVASLLSPDDIITAARRYGIKVVVFDTSGDPKDTFSNLTEPLAIPSNEMSPDEVFTYGSVKQYVDRMSKSVKEVQESQGNSETFLGLSQIFISETRLWGSPKEQKLFNLGGQGLVGLQSFLPEGQFFVDYTFEPKVKSKSLWGIIKHWSVGELRFRRSIDVTKASVVILPVTENQLNDPKYILSERFQVAMDLGLNFDTKLALMNSILMGEFSQDFNKADLPPSYSNLEVPEPLEFARILTGTILLDLMNEQVGIRPFSFHSQVPKRELWDKLDLLKKLTHYDYTQFKLDHATPSGELLLNLIVNMKYFSLISLNFWDRYSLFYSTKNKQVTDTTNAMLTRLVETVFPDAKAADTLIQSKLVDLKKEHKKKKIKRAQAKEFVSKNLSGLSDSANSAVVQRNDVHEVTDRIREETQQIKLRNFQTARTELSIGIKNATEEQIARLKITGPRCELLLNNAKAHRAKTVGTPL